MYATRIFRLVIYFVCEKKNWTQWGIEKIGRFIKSKNKRTFWSVGIAPISDTIVWCIQHQCHRALFALVWQRWKHSIANTHTHTNTRYSVLWHYQYWSGSKAIQTAIKFHTSLSGSILVVFLTQIDLIIRPKRVSLLAVLCHCLIANVKRGFWCLCMAFITDAAEHFPFAQNSNFESKFNETQFLFEMIYFFIFDHLSIFVDSIINWNATTNFVFSRRKKNEWRSYCSMNNQLQFPIK